MNFQIRITEDNEVVKTLMMEYIHCSAKVLIFQHNKTDNVHCHVYLFSLQRTEQAIRKYLGHYLQREKFSVKKTCGGPRRLPITEEGAYQYGTEESLTDPVFIKGFQTHEMEVLKLRAEAYYKPLKERKLEHGDTIVVTKEIMVEKRDRVWERLQQDLDKHVDKTIPQIKAYIAAKWLNEGRALPRACDLHRYAVSIWYRCKYIKEEDGVPEDALENVYRSSGNL